MEVGNRDMRSLAEVLNYSHIEVTYSAESELCIYQSCLTYSTQDTTTTTNTLISSTCTTPVPGRAQNIGLNKQQNLSLSFIIFPRMLSTSLQSEIHVSIQRCNQ